MLRFFSFFGMLVLLVMGKQDEDFLTQFETTFPPIVNQKPIDVSHFPNPNLAFKAVIYNLTIAPNFQNSTFDGFLLLHVTPIYNVSRIVLNKGNYLVDVEISGMNYTDLDVYQTDENLELILSRGILKANQEYVISMSFKDLKIRDDMTGFYKIKNYESNWIYLTNFNSHHVRKVFPCFDDVSIRSTFILNVELPSKDYVQVHANSDLSSSTIRRFTFESISNISVHNFAFAIMTDSMYPGNTWGDEVLITAYTKPKMVEFVTHATDKVPGIMDAFSQIFDVEYPLKKVDLIAVADYVPHKISNLGLIVLPEYFLLYDKKNPSVLEDLKITKSISHAIASMWLQNIVTPATEDQAWVGEGLVKYYEYFVQPDKSQLVDQFVINVHRKTMLEDSLNLTSRSIQVDRAASIFRMLETYNGTKNFTKRVQNYVKNRKNQAASIEDLYKAFGREILPNWLERTGYPVLNVSFHLGAVNLSAETFSVYPNDFIKNGSWKIPFELSNVDSGSTTTFLLDLSSHITKLSIVTNNPTNLTIISHKHISGYYRVNYDNTTWNRIVEVLNSNNFTKIHPIDRSAILDDMFNLAKAGYLDYKILFMALKYLKNETEYLPLKTAINGLNYLLKIYESSKIDEPSDEHYKKLFDWVADIFKPIYKKLSMRQNSDSLLYSEICNFACNMDDVRCFSDVMTLFQNWIKRNKRISGDFRSAVYCNALKFEYKDLYKKKYFDKMLEKLKQVTLSSEKLDILMGLGCHHNFTKLEWFLNESMSNFEKSGIYKAELVKVMESIYSSSLNKSEQMLSFLIDHYQQFESYFNGTWEIMDMVSNMGRMHQSEHMTEMLSHFKSVVGEGDLSLVVQETIEKIDKEMQISNKIVHQLMQVLDDSNIDPSFSTTTAMPTTPTKSTTSKPTTPTESTTSKPTTPTESTTSTEPTSSPTPPPPTNPTTSTKPTTSTEPTTTTNQPNTSSEVPPNPLTSTTSTTEKPNPSTTPAPEPSSSGNTVLKVLFGLVIFAIILLFGYFIFVKFFKVPY